MVLFKQFYQTFKKQIVLGDSSLWISWVLHALQIGTDCFVPYCLFKDVQYSKQSCKTERVSLFRAKGSFEYSVKDIDSISHQSRRQACLLPITKFEFLKLRDPVLQHNPTMCASVIRFSSHHHAGIGAQGIGAKMLILWVLLCTKNCPSSLTQETCVFYQNP